MFEVLFSELLKMVINSFTDMYLWQLGQAGLNNQDFDKMQFYCTDTIKSFII